MAGVLSRAETANGKGRLGYDCGLGLDLDVNGGLSKFRWTCSLSIPAGMFRVYDHSGVYDDVGQWYERSEQSARAGLFYCFNGVGASTGGILSFAVGPAKGFVVWRSIFILAGDMTVFWGVLLFFFLPDNIMDTKRFSNQEKAMLIARSQQNQTGVFNKKIKIAQVKEALVDLQIWLLFLFVLLNETINGGLASFSKLFIKGLANGDALLTTAYGIPAGIWQVMFVFSGPWLAGRFKNIRT